MFLFFPIIDIQLLRDLLFPALFISSISLIMSQPKPFSIAIVGGGIAGLTLAISLHKRNVPVKIYERARKFGEIGAGVAFGPNAVQAMQHCDKGIHSAYLTVATHNQWPSKKEVYFDFLDGTAQETRHQESLFHLSNPEGQNGVHRAHFLDEMVKLVPPEIASFGKLLDTISENPDGKLTMTFHDGTTASADAIVGCDGIKSRVRALLVGEDSPVAQPQYTHKYAYRGLIPMKQAVEALGEERAKNACIYMGPDGHVLTFAVNGGETLNLVAFRTNADEWPSTEKTTLQAKKETVLREFSGWGGNVRKLLEFTKADLDCWGLFDLGDHPVDSYCKGRICISGDAAHATTPHHGSGAGFAIEDSAVLADLISDERVKSHRDLEAVFAAFDATRRERSQWLVQSSRITGDAYEWRDRGAGRDPEKIKAVLEPRFKKIWGIDVGRMCADAKEELGRRLK